MSGRSDSRSETPSEKAPEKQPEAPEKMTLTEESQSSAAPAVSESLKLEAQADNPQLQAPKIPAQAGWPESPVSAPSNPNWAPQPGAPQNPASSLPAGPNWDVHVDQSKAWDSEEKSNAQQPAAPTSQSAWPKTSASSGTDAWNPPRPNNTSAQWGPPPQSSQHPSQQSTLPSTWPQHPSNQPSSTPAQSLPSSMPSSIGNSQIPPNPANPNWGPPSQHQTQQKSQQPPQSQVGPTATPNWGPSTPSQSSDNRSGPWGPGSSGDAPATSSAQNAAPPSWNTPGSTPSTSQPQTPSWGTTPGEPRASTSSWGTSGVDGIGLSSFGDSRQLKLPDISHLSEEQQKLINNNEGWGKRAISQNTKWEISESSQHDTRPRLPTQATGTELWDPVKGPSVNQHMNQAQSLREPQGGRNQMWPHAPSGPGPERESSWPGNNHPGGGMPPQQRYPPSEHWPGRDPIAHQPVQRPPWPSQNHPYGGDSDWSQSRPQHNNEPSPWDQPPRPSYSNPGGNRGGYGGGRDWNHHDKRPNDNISGWPGDSRRPNPGGMPNYLNISNALKYNLLPASIRSQMQMCGRETLEQLDRHCQMLLQEWGKRESLASNMNQSNFSSYQQRQQIEQMINQHSSNEQKHRNDIMSLLNPGFGGGHRGGHPGSRPFPHIPDHSSSFPQEPIWGGLPKEPSKPHSDLDEMPNIGGINLNPPKQNDVVIPPAFVPGQRWEGAKQPMELERNKPIGEYQQNIPAIFKNTPNRESKWSDSAASDSPSWGNSNMREIWRGGPRGGSGGHWGGNHPDSNQTWGPHGNSQR